MTDATTTDAADTDSRESPDLGLGGPVPQSADPIDRVVRLAPTWQVFALAACGLLVAGTVLWMFAGRVPQVVVASGLFVDGGYHEVRTPRDGTVDEVSVSLGDRVSEGQRLLTFVDGSVLKADDAGAVTSVFVAPGARVLAGATMVGLTDPREEDSVAALVPIRSAGSLTVGRPVEVEVSSAPASEYGYLTGTLTELSGVPVSISEVAKVLGLDEQRAVSEFGEEPGVLAQITLDRDADNPSGHKWTVGSGPPYALAQGTSVTARIVLSEESPIDLVFPDLAGSGGADAS